MARFIHKISHDVFDLSIQDDQYYLLEIRRGKEFGMKHLVDLAEAEKELGGLILPVLVMCGEMTTTDLEVLNALGKRNTNPYSLADAFVLTSLNHKILASFYIRIIKPARPTRFFSSKEEALDWLKQYFK